MTHRMKNIVITLLLGVSSLTVAAQTYSETAAYRNRGVETPMMKRYHIDEQRRSLEFPEIPGYKLLKCDFHIHTIYSDGHVTPAIRVEEAFYEGLDAISITDHIEVPARPDVVTKDMNRAYELAKDYAETLDVMLIPGTEITREYPTGHYNAIFIKDANAFTKFVNPERPQDGNNVDGALQEAKNQGAFVFWNHPFFQDPDRLARWKPEQEALFEKGLLDGIEVINRDRYYPIVHKWALDKNLTVIGTTDIHSTIRIDPGMYRQMTLVLAKERSPEALREALDNRRTVAYSQNYLYGSRQNILPILEACIQTKVVNHNSRMIIFEVFNRSGMPFEFEIIDYGELVQNEYDHYLVSAYGRYPIIFSGNNIAPGQTYKIKVKMLNLIVGYSEPMEYIFEIKL